MTNRVDRWNDEITGIDLVTFQLDRWNFHQPGFPFAFAVDLEEKKKKNRCSMSILRRYFVIDDR